MNSAAPSGQTPGPGQEGPAGEVADQLSVEALTPADTTRFIEQVAQETGEPSR